MVKKASDFVKKIPGEPINAGEKFEVVMAKFSEFEYNSELVEGVFLYEEDYDEETNVGIHRTSSKVLVKQIREVCDSEGDVDSRDENVYTFAEPIEFSFKAVKGNQFKYLCIAE